MPTTPFPSVDFDFAGADDHLDLDDLRRDPDESDLSEPLQDLLTDADTGPLFQRAALTVCGGPLAARWAARVADDPLVVLATPRGRFGLDLSLAAQSRRGLVEIAPLELKGPRTKGQDCAVAALHTPQLPEAHALLRAVHDAVDTGQLVLEPHDCSCAFSYHGGELLVKGSGARQWHVIAQTTQVGFLSATESSEPLPAPWNRCGDDARIRRIHPQVRGLYVTVKPLEDGLTAFYRRSFDRVDELVWPDRYREVTYAGLLQAFLAAAAGRRLPLRSRVNLQRFAARAWAAVGHGAWQPWTPALLAAVPPALTGTRGCALRCCAA